MWSSLLNVEKIVCLPDIQCFYYPFDDLRTCQFASLAIRFNQQSLDSGSRCRPTLYSWRSISLLANVSGVQILSCYCANVEFLVYANSLLATYVNGTDIMTLLSNLILFPFSLNTRKGLQQGLSSNGSSSGPPVPILLEDFQRDGLFSSRSVRYSSR